MAKKLKKPREIFVRICPKCKSTKVKSRGMIFGRAFSQNFVCLSCGFQGSIFPEVKLEELNKYNPTPGQEPVDINPSTQPIFADRSGPLPKWLKIGMIIAVILFFFWLVWTIVRLVFTF